MSYKASVLQDVIEQVYTAKDIDSAKEIATTRIVESKIPNEMKSLMKMKIGQCETLLGLQKYLTNSMFKMMGMGN
jgi:hypothetical protein